MATEAERILWQVRPCSMFDTSSDATLEDAHDPAYTPWGQGTNLQFAGSYYLNSDNTQESLPFIFLGCDARSSMLIEVQWKDPRTGLRAESALVIPVEAAAWYRIDDEPLKPELVNIEEIVAATIARFHFHPIGLASNAAFIKAQHGQDQAEEAMRHTEHELRAANVDNAELNSRIRSAEEAGQAAAAAHRDANARARRYAEENKALTEAMDELRRQAEKAKNSDGEIARLKEKVKEANLDAHRTLVLKGERDSARAELEKVKAENEGLKEQLDTAHLLYDKASKKTAEVKASGQAAERQVSDQLQRLLKDLDSARTSLDLSEAQCMRERELRSSEHTQLADTRRRLDAATAELRLARAQTAVQETSMEEYNSLLEETDRLRDQVVEARKDAAGHIAAFKRAEKQIEQVVRDAEKSEAASAAALKDMQAELQRAKAERKNPPPHTRRLRQRPARCHSAPAPRSSPRCCGPASPRCE
jgi:hypothetical protein